jgi:hypothetical protein
LEKSLGEGRVGDEDILNDLNGLGGDEARPNMSAAVILTSVLQTLRPAHFDAKWRYDTIVTSGAHIQKECATNCLPNALPGETVSFVDTAPKHESELLRPVARTRDLEFLSLKISSPHFHPTETYDDASVNSTFPQPTPSRSAQTTSDLRSLQAKNRQDGER